MNIGRRAFLGILGGVAALPLIRETAWASRATERVLRWKVVGPRDYVVGFPPTVIPPGETSTIAVVPEIDFKPHRLVVPSNIARHFYIVDLSMGGISQISKAFSAEVFSEAGSPAELSLDCVVFGRGRTMSVTVSNESAVEQTFTMGIVGKELVYGPALGPQWKVHEPVTDNVLDDVVRDARRFAREEGYDDFQTDSVEGGVLFGKMVRKPVRRSLLDRLLRRNT